ncbi:MAG: TPM domain-containing protein [Saprospiraceae bacterium]|nr:TPM domain-containing protein [Lewinella sp.]
MIRFFSKQEEEKIIESIKTAELQTSGEIRVHLLQKPKEHIMADALRIFHKLGMHETEQRNGVLILLAPGARQFAIIGDEGINNAVPEGFWEEERNVMLEHFRREAYGEGVALVIRQIGEKLKAFFPHQDDDVNELPDEISYE